ncbi:hypothetical protein [Pseudonocardia sp. D17]|uniref:hypothetical protein n=1 Tax=Pseudonocardia sp. D17 TaxID=882661 RepID=UPI002B3A4233|nr:hypothetical protein PSD17_39460 [Pseudonocardia sp. D17]
MTTTTDTPDAPPDADAQARQIADDVLATVDSATANPDQPDETHLPEGYLLVLALRETDTPCDRCGEDDQRDPHNRTELAVFNRMDPEAALSVLASAMRHIGDRAGIGVQFGSSEGLMAAMAAMAAGMGGMRRPDEDDAPATNVGQYL